MISAFLEYKYLETCLSSVFQHIGFDNEYEVVKELIFVVWCLFYILSFYAIIAYVDP